VLRYGATDVPIIQLSLSSPSLPDSTLNDLGQNIIRLAFSGEIRATGNILPDQYAFLLRCGIATVETLDGTDPAASGGPLLLRLSALRTQRADPVRPSPNDTTWRAAEYLIAVDRKIGSDPATTQNNVSNPKTLFNSANRPAS
jgi:hypothetical protein